MGAVRFLIGLLLAVQVIAQCNLRLRLSDSKKDGWNSNTLKVTVADKVPTFTVVGSFAKVVSAVAGTVTLAGGDTGSLQFSAPVGSSIKFVFNYDAVNWPRENSWSLELFDSYAPFGTVVLTKSALNSLGIPVAPNVASVTCGPRPIMTGFSVQTTPGPYVHQVKFDWPSLAASDADQAVTYTVSYRRLTDAPNNWIILVGGTTQSELTAILPPNANCQFQLVATNMYGPGPAVTWTYNVPSYPASTIYVKLYDSLANGWGTYDGFVFLALNGVTIGSATFPCAQPGSAACSSLVVPFSIPNGIAWSLSFAFQSPSVNPQDCSFRILKTLVEATGTLFYSGQSAKGPTSPKGTVAISFPGTPIPVKVVVPPKFTCPTAEPKVGATCPGVTAAPCQYDLTCCCPNEAAAASRYCSADTYVCTGTNGKWQATLASLPCKTDPTFRCPSQCQVKPPVVGAACPTNGMSCNYPVVCAAGSTCQQTDTFTCTALKWAKTTNCLCTKLPVCAPWQNLVNTGDCCKRVPTCVTDPASTICSTPGPWSACTGTCVNGAGTGKQTRTTYTRSGTTCVTATATQNCPLTNCPVNCVGAFGPYSTCSASCGQGTRTRTYKITVPAKAPGTACPYADGFIEASSCIGNGTCGPQCNLQLVVYDSMKDGWTGGASVTVAYAGTTLVGAVPAGRSSQMYSFKAARGTTLTATYTAGTDPRPTDHSFEIAYVVPPSTVMKALLQNPVGLQTKTKPDASKSVIVQCVLCDAVNIDTTCANLKRRACSLDQPADNTCGACLSGYTGTASGNTACIDINECNASPNPCGIHVCSNSPAGSYTCTCKAGYVMKDGACVEEGVCPEYAVRKEWGDMTPVEKDKFIRAVRALGGAFWKKLGDVHAVTFGGGSNIHGSGLFLPWHRGLLNDVEDKLLALPGDLACTPLCYWDWTRVSVSNDPNTYLKNMFTSAKANGLWTGLGVMTGYQSFSSMSPEHPFSTLTDCYRGSGGSVGWSTYGPSQIYSLMKVTTYTQLWQNLNGGGHNSIHNYVGGVMASATSAWDPIFMLHHGNIDLLWAGWQSCNGFMDANNPGSAGWDNSISFTAPMLASVTKTYTPKSVYNIEDLKTRYAKAYIQRVVDFNAGFCKTQSSSWFAMLEVEADDQDLGQNVGSYPVDLGVVSNTSDSDVENETATVVPLPAEEQTAPAAPPPAATASAPVDTPTSASTTAEGPVVTKTKTKLKRKTKGPKKVGVEGQMDRDGGVTENVLCSYETYKSVLEKTGDEDEALSAQIDEECSQSKFTFPTDNMYPESWLELNPHLRRMCAEGLCFHECYLRGSGPTADQLKSNYQKEKEKGKVETRKKIRGANRKNKTEGSAPTEGVRRRPTGSYSAKSLIETLALRAFNESAEF